MAILFCGSAFIAFFTLPGTVWLVPLGGGEKNFNQQALDMLCASSAEFRALGVYFVLVTAM